MTVDDVWGTRESPLDLGVEAGSSGPPHDGGPAQREDELARARVLGWVPLHPAPLYRLVPAAWPRELRSWLLDPLLTDDGWHDEEAVAGLPPRPSGRLWLVRSPWADIPVYAVYELLRTQVGHRDPHEAASMYRAASTVLHWSRERAWQECSPQTRELIDAWRKVGRSAVSIEELVEAELTPAGLERWTTATGLSEQLVVEWLLALNATPDGESLHFVSDWVAAGLPGRPPRDVDLYAGQEPRELRNWIDAGFSIDEALAGEGDVPLDVAIVWQAAGFTFGEAHELLQADRLLTPAEALAFSTGEISSKDRVAWVGFGFNATEAAAWARAGLKAGQARLWRARGWVAGDVIARREFPPNLFPESGYYSFSEINDIPDPPGTRGTSARPRPDG